MCKIYMYDHLKRGDNIARRRCITRTTTYVRVLVYTLNKDVQTDYIISILDCVAKLFVSFDAASPCTTLN